MVNRRWDFGDGNTGYGKVVTHTYDEAGEYTVSLTVFGPGDKSDVAIKPYFITVTPPYAIPTALFSASPSRGTVPLKVFFTDRSTGDIENWCWNFGGRVRSYDQNPSYTYDRAGSYYVTLEVTGPAGSDSAWQWIDVFNPAETGYGNSTGYGYQSVYGE